MTADQSETVEQPKDGEARLTAALAPFGWTCTPDFWQRYYQDPWVFNLANAVERLTAQNPTLVATSVTYCVTHDATDHDGKKWTDCRFRQLFYFENPMDEHTILWADEIAPTPDAHSCDDPIRCSTCLAEKATKATARRTAARKARR